MDSNTILNAVHLYRPIEGPTRPILMPTLNTYRSDLAYEEIIEQPDYTVNNVLERNRWCIAFVKLNGQVFQVTLHNEVIQCINPVRHSSEL